MPEVIVTLIIIAVLAAILFPILNKAKPDENEAMHKKATFIFERVVNELATDKYLYPDNGEFIGLGNISPVVINGTEHAGFTKFCTLFASRINKAANSQVNCETNGKSVTSVEGIDWYLPISDFQNVDFETVKVDVNGSKGPNCLYNADTCKRPDQFTYQIRGGTKVPFKAVQNFDETAPPPGRGERPGEPDVTPMQKTGLKWWSIICKVSGSGAVYGMGENKVNGHYQLVAIPSPGYVGSWFTKNVTVKDANFTDCDVEFTKIDRCLIPGVCDNNPDTPVPPAPPDPEPNPVEPGVKSYCINKIVTGDPAGCTISGTNPKECGLEPGTHTLTATIKEGYQGSWADNKNTVTIIDKDVTATLECTPKDEEEEKCYNITANITGLCALDGAGCKTPGTYNLTITPKDNYTYNNSTGVSNYQVIVTNSDVAVNITCNPPLPSEEETDPCCETAFGSGAKYIAKSNACVKDLGVQSSEAVDCKTQKQYCTGNWAYWNYPAVYPTTYKTCLELNMDIPSKAKFLELYNNRQSVFPESHWYTPDRQAGYFTNESTRYLPSSQSASQYNGKYVWQYTVHIPYDNQVHSIAPRNSGARGLCYAPAPAICKSSSNSDSGSDSAAINAKLTTPVVEGVHKSSMNYTVTWTVNNPPLSKGKKYKVTVYDWVGRLIYTYYGVTTTTSGSQNGTITGIPSSVPSNWVKLSVSFY